MKTLVFKLLLSGAAVASTAAAPLQTPQEPLKTEQAQAKPEIVSINVQVRMPDGSYKSLLLMGKDLEKYNSIYWNGGAEQVLMPFYRQVRGEHEKVDFLQKKLNTVSPATGSMPILLIKEPNCNSLSWP